VSLHKLAEAWVDMVPHTATLTALARDARSIVEFGVRGGVSTWALLDGLPPDGLMTSVDIDPRCPIPDRVADDPRWRFLVGDDLMVNVPPADLVLIDTSHEYHHTIAELDLAQRIGATVIALHDYTTPDVQDAAHGFARRDPRWVLRVEPSEWGLAVLRCQ